MSVLNTESEKHFGAGDRDLAWPIPVELQAFLNQHDKICIDIQIFSEGKMSEGPNPLRLGVMLS